MGVKYGRANKAEWVEYLTLVMFDPGFGLLGLDNSGGNFGVWGEPEGNLHQVIEFNCIRDAVQDPADPRRIGVQMRPIILPPFDLAPLPAVALGKYMYKFNVVGAGPKFQPLLEAYLNVVDPPVLAQVQGSGIVLSTDVQAALKKG